MSSEIWKGLYSAIGKMSYFVKTTFFSTLWRKKGVTIKHGVWQLLYLTFLLARVSQGTGDSFQQVFIPENCFSNSNETLDWKPVCVFSMEKYSADKVDVSCPQAGVLRIVGDYKIFRINCTASFPLNFTFDGTKPTEAINAFVERIVMENVTRENYHYRGVVNIYSIPSLYDVKRTMEANTSPISRLSHSFTDIESKFRYSRTGSYIFSGFKDLAGNSTKMYIFFEEPLATPGFIGNAETKTVRLGKNILIPCRPTSYDLRVNLITTCKNATTVKKTYSPTFGFIVHEDDLAVADAHNKYICESDHEGRKISMEINSNNETEHFRKSSKADERAVFISPSLENQGFGLYGTKMTCRYVSKLPQSDPISLAAIGSANPIDFQLKHEFSLPAFMNRSYFVHIGEQVSKFPNHRAVRQAIPEQVISVYCGKEEKHEMVTISTILTGETFTFDFDQDWTALDRTEDNIRHWFKGGMDHQGEVYENQMVWFRCRISRFVLLDPCIWYVRYKNGTVKAEKHDYGWTSGVSRFSKTVTADVESVSCAASIFHRNLWWNTTLPVNVQVCTRPEFLGNETSNNFIVNSKQILNCSASGHPLPKVRWERDGQVVTSEGGGYALLEFPNVQIEDAGEYICIASNCAQKSVSKSFLVKVYSEPLLPNTVTVVVAIGLLLISIIACTGAAVVLMCSRRKSGGLTITEIEEFMSGNGQFVTVHYEKPTDFSLQRIPYDKDLEVSRKRFQIDKTSTLGKGASGVVYKCLLDEKPVAVKANADIASLKSLLSELKVLMYLGSHDNIVKLLGAHTEDLAKGKAYLFVDLCPFGNLQDFLINGRKQFTSEQRPNDGKVFTIKDFYTWAIQIATGMSYLHYKKIIHGDLATRNVLLTESRTAKITDFGLSNRLYDYMEYVRLKDEHLPWRWLALESMKESKFSSQSDIWSYGVTLWEIFSLAETPFSNCSWGIPFITQIENGMRLEQPNYASKDLYENVMLQCWQADPSSRPSLEKLSAIIKTLGDSVNIPCAYVRVAPKYLNNKNNIALSNLEASMQILDTSGKALR